MSHHASPSQRISNRSIIHQMSSNSLDDVYLKTEENSDKEKTSNFSRGIRERFSARFKLTSKINALVGSKELVKKQMFFFVKFEIF